MAALQEKLYRFPGFFIQKKTLRKYNSTSGANILGNIREVNQNDIDNDPYYRAGDYTGDLGIEKSYETYLRGKKGQEILIRDAHGRIQGRFENGARDVAPVSGKDLTLSIDYNASGVWREADAGQNRCNRCHRAGNGRDSRPRVESRLRPLTAHRARPRQELP